MNQLIVKNRKIHYEVIHKKVKNITFRFNEQGVFIVVCNPYVPNDKIESLISEKVEWILKQQEKLKRHQEIYQPSKESLTILGKKIDIELHKETHNHIVEEDGVLQIYYNDEMFIEKSLQHYLRRRTKSALEPLVEKYKKIFKEDYGIEGIEVKYRDIKGKWGSCMPNTGNIVLNYKLIHAPIAFSEYVILHEFCHLIQPNHSKSFYYVVEKYMPDYKVVSKSCVLEES